MIATTTKSQNRKRKKRRMRREMQQKQRKSMVCAWLGEQYLGALVRCLLSALSLCLLCSLARVFLGALVVPVCLHHVLDEMRKDPKELLRTEKVRAGEGGCDSQWRR
jgi:hypothetical protein